MGPKMNLDALVECELQKVDWTKVKDLTGPATNVPVALRELLAANSPEECDTAYWKLENHVVVQGGLFEAACFVVPVLLAALVRPDRPSFVRIGLLELLFQIVNGHDYVGELKQDREFHQQCINSAREGLWILYREFIEGEPDAVREIIQLIDGDQRLSFLEHAEARNLRA
jgi:hypothetical protein